MKRFYVLVAAAVLLAGPIARSSALTWIVNTDPLSQWVLSGTQSDTATIIPNPFPPPPFLGTYTDFLAAGSNTVVTPSTISYGLTFATQNVPFPSSDTFTNVPTTFLFTVQQEVLGVPTGPIHTLEVNGRIHGPMSVDAIGKGSSSANFIADLITDYGADGIKGTGDDVLSLAGTVLSPVAVTSKKIDTLIGGFPVQLYVDYLNALTPPASSFPLAVGGYITDVPEPGTLALLVGSGLTGSLFLMRRRRARA